jgi:hypothetical protein
MQLPIPAGCFVFFRRVSGRDFARFEANGTMCQECHGSQQAAKALHGKTPFSSFSPIKFLPDDNVIRAEPRLRRLTKKSSKLKGEF